MVRCMQLLCGDRQRAEGSAAPRCQEALAQVVTTACDRRYAVAQSGWQEVLQGAGSLAPRCRSQIIAGSRSSLELVYSGFQTWRLVEPTTR
jgi:hypothetical protein